MTEAIKITYGQPAIWCGQCRKTGKDRTGVYQCSQPSGVCLYPVPALGLEETLILKLFSLLRNQWNRVAGFSGERRAGIPFTDVKAAAQLIGLKLNYRRLEVINTCIDVVVSEDIKTMEEASKSNGGRK